jgi:hypothetical protein
LSPVRARCASFGGRRIELSDTDLTSEPTALLDVLIVEHRERTKALQDRKASALTTIAGITTGVVALAAILVPRLPYGKLDTADNVLLVIGGLATVFVVVCFVDAVGGPVKSVMKPSRKAADEASQVYNTVQPSMDPVGVRTAVLDRWRADEALARRELIPREECVRGAARAGFVAIAAVELLGMHLLA